MSDGQAGMILLGIIVGLLVLAYSSALRRWLHVVRRRRAIFIRLGTCSSIVPNTRRKSATKSGTARRSVGIGVSENRSVLGQLDVNDFEDEPHSPIHYRRRKGQVLATRALLCRQLLESRVLLQE